MNFHSIMFENRCAIGYYEDEVKVFIREANIVQLNKIANAVCEEFGISPSEIKVISTSSKPYKLAISISPDIINWDKIKSDINNGDGRQVEKEQDENLLGYEYKIDKENDFVIARHKGGTCQISVPLSKLKKLYDLLPEQFTTKDIVEKGQEINLKINYQQALALIRVFSHVEFNAEVTRVGRQVIGIKDMQGYLRDENRNKMRLEREVIGTPYEVG